LCVAHHEMEGPERGGAMSEAERYDVTRCERPSVTVDMVILV
jgi:hypothetical protein